MAIDSRVSAEDTSSSTPSWLVSAVEQPQVRRALRAAKGANRITYSTPIGHVPDRRELALLLNRRRLLGCGAEVGVKRGEYSAEVLSAWRGRHLISIDPWLAAPDEQYTDVANVEQDAHDRFYDETLQRLAPFGERSSVWRMTGTEASVKIPHHCLDFVYLDARHDYESVMEDLDLWFDKVRPGGVLAGHDYLDGAFAEGDFGVRSAVDEFFGSRDMRVKATFLDRPWISWFVSL